MYACICIFTFQPCGCFLQAGTGTVVLIDVQEAFPQFQLAAQVCLYLQHHGSSDQPISLLLPLLQSYPQERQQHVGPIIQLLFTADGSRLLSCGADGRVVVYAVHHGLLPVKALITPPPLTHGGVSGSGSTPGKGKALKPAAINSKSSIATNGSGSGSGSSVCAAVSSDGCWIAVGQPATAPGAVGPDGGSGGAAVVLFNTALEAVLHIECTATGFNR